MTRRLAPTTAPTRCSNTPSTLVFQPRRHGVSSSPSLIPRSNAAGVVSLSVPTSMPTTKKKNEKTPMEFIAEIPPIEVEGSTAVCEGGQATTSARQQLHSASGRSSHLLQPSLPAFDGLTSPLLSLPFLCCCDVVGGGAMGHPVEYIQLNKIKLSEPEVCKYCGLRFVQKQGKRRGGH